MRMTGEHERDVARNGLVKVVGVVRQKQMRRAVARQQLLPIGFSEQQVIDAAEDEGTGVMVDDDAFVPQRPDADARQVLR